MASISSTIESSYFLLFSTGIHTAHSLFWEQRVGRRESLRPGHCRILASSSDLGRPAGKTFHRNDRKVCWPHGQSRLPRTRPTLTPLRFVRMGHPAHAYLARPQNLSPRGKEREGRPQGFWGGSFSWAVIVRLPWFAVRRGAFLFLWLMSWKLLILSWLREH